MIRAPRSALHTQNAAQSVRIMEATAIADAIALPSWDMVAKCCRGPTRKNEL
jgi:hypothetical protein